jgi:hypothetical protein
MPKNVATLYIYSEVYLLLYSDKRVWIYLKREKLPHVFFISSINYVVKTGVNIFKYIFIFNWHIAIVHIYGVQCDILIHVYNV